MRIGIIVMSAAFFMSFSAEAAFKVPTDGSFGTAVAAANADTSGNTYEIEVSGRNSASKVFEKSVSVKGLPEAELTGTVKFAGKGISSSISNININTGSGAGIANGELGASTGQNLIMKNVKISGRNNYYGGAVSNTGNLDIREGSSFTDNSGNVGGALYGGSGKITVDGRGRIFR